MKCSDLRASNRDEEQGRAHSCRAAVEGLLAVFKSSDYHADTLRAGQSIMAYLLVLYGNHKMPMLWLQKSTNFLKTEFRQMKTDYWQTYWSNVRQKKLAVFWFFEVLPGLSQVNQITEDPRKQSLKISIKCRKSQQEDGLTGMKRVHPSRVPVSVDLTTSCRHGLVAWCPLSKAVM